MSEPCFIDQKSRQMGQVQCCADQTSATTSIELLDQEAVEKPPDYTPVLLESAGGLALPEAEKKRPIEKAPLDGPLECKSTDVDDPLKCSSADVDIAAALPSSRSGCQARFKVLLKKRERTSLHLGLRRTGSALLVVRLPDHEPVPAWSITQDEKIQLGDRIISVNGLTNIGQLDEALFTQGDLTLELARSEEFTVSLKKNGDKGIGVTITPENDVLRIEAIKEGPIQAWNAAQSFCEESEVRPYDRIVSVNGFRADQAKMVDELVRAEQLELHLLRPATSELW